MWDLVLLAVLENLVEDEVLVGHGLLEVPGLCLVLLPLTVNPEPCDLVVLVELVELVVLEVDGVLAVDGLLEELVVHAVDGGVVFDHI